MTTVAVERAGASNVYAVDPTPAFVEVLSAFWDAALDTGLTIPYRARVMRFGHEGELTELFHTGGLAKCTEPTMRVRSDFATFDDLWNGFLSGVGPAGAFCAALAPDRQTAVRQALFVRVGSPDAGFSLDAVARAVRGCRR